MNNPGFYFYPILKRACFVVHTNTDEDIKHANSPDLPGQAIRPYQNKLYMDETRRFRSVSFVDIN